MTSCIGEVERALRESEERFRLAFENGPIGMAIVGLDYRLLKVNKVLCEMLGYTEQELTVLTFVDVTHPEDVQKDVQLAEEVFTGRIDSYKMQLRCIKKDRQIVWGGLTATAIRDPNGKALYGLAMIEDTTERRRAEEALLSAHGKLRATLDSIQEHMNIVDLDFSLTEVNDTAIEAFGLPDKESVIGRKCFEVFRRGKEVCPNCAVAEAYRTRSPARRTTTPEEDRLTRGRSFELFAYPIMDRHGNVCGAVEFARDITERKRAAEALTAEKERLAVTLQSIGDGVIATDMDGKVALLNRVAQQLTGWSEEEAVGRALDALFRILHEENRRRRKNPVQEVLETDRAIEMGNDSLLIARDGTERIIAYNASPIRNADGNTIGAVLTFRDITEKRRMEEELLNARRIESIGILAGGIAHDFNNILTAATGKIFLARMHARTDADLLEKLTGAEKAIFQAKRLTQQLLTFSKGGAPIKRTTSISELLQETADFALSGSNVRCEFSIPDDVWVVEVDVGQISQVINNVIINAAQAMPQGGVVTVSVENVNLGTRDSLPLKEGKYVKISIQDRGTGIPREHFRRIFDPYFTTKPRGSGLGLAAAYTIVDKHSGCITLESEPGVGTTFFVYLLASEKEVPRKEPAEEKAIAGTGRILLMDDEQEIRDTTGEVLKRLGYEVHFATDGAEVVERYITASESGRSYDAVILDLTVPGAMGGKEAMKKLLEADPNVKVLVSSGYFNDPLMANYRAHGFSGVITKPYKGEELSRALHEVLTGSRE